MNDNIKYILYGLITAIIPINILVNAFQKNNLKVNYKLSNIVFYIPIFFSIINIIILNTVKYVLPNFQNNYIVVGTIIGIVYSSVGRFILNIPEKILNMSHPNMFHVYAIITWIIVYFLLMTAFKNI